MNTPSAVARLEIRNLCRRFGSFSISRFNLDVMPGEVHVLVGENGSGKSASMKTVAGMYERDSGEVFLDGQEVRFQSISEARVNGLVYQHQDIQLFENLSIAENVCSETLKRGYSRMRTLIRCRDLLQQVGIPLDPSRLVGTLAYAEKQLVAVARTIATEAKVVIFDEPTSAMSEREREILFRIVAFLQERKTGIIYISHRLDEIRQIGNRVTVMHQGRRVATSGVRSIDRTTLVQLMTGKAPRHHYPRTEVKPGPVVLAVEHLQSRPVLKDISFALRKGEILGITGLMGSGRTRLAHCLVGAQPVEGGAILMNGREVRITSPGDALARGLVLVPEDRVDEALFTRFSLSSNVTIASLSRFRTPLGLDGNTMHELVGEYSRRLAIRPGNPDDIISLYSGGNQQKVVVARAFMNRGLVYLLDEPTRGVDVAAKVDIYNSMNDLVSKGASIILFSSEIDEILGMSDRILVLAEGRIAGEMTREEATREAILNFATED